MRVRLFFIVMQDKKQINIAMIRHHQAVRPELVEGSPRSGGASISL
jgi:hypothetical protein